jgi:hypothetical protein
VLIHDKEGSHKKLIEELCLQSRSCRSQTRRTQWSVSTESPSI